MLQAFIPQNVTYASLWLNEVGKEALSGSYGVSLRQGYKDAYKV
jgi:hypothetical protein